MMRLNPFARVETIRNAAGAIDGLRIVAPVKGRGLQTTLVTRAEDESTFTRVRRTVLTALLDAQAIRDVWSAAAEHDRELFERTGLFVADSGVPRAVTIEPTSPMTLPDRDDVPLISDRGFVVVERVVAGALLASLRRYYAELIAEGFATCAGEGGEPHRWVVHNDPAARGLHSPIGAIVQRAAGEPLKPSFTYLLQYLEGASLPPHRDRPQCAVTAVLQVDFDPEPAGATPWPLCFATPRGRCGVSLSLGDLVVFRGTDVEHSRDPLTCGRSSTNLAFCFVPVGFAGSLD